MNPLKPSRPGFLLGWPDLPVGLANQIGRPGSLGYCSWNVWKILEILEIPNKVLRLPSATVADCEAFGMFRISSSAVCPVTGVPERVSKCVLNDGLENGAKEAFFFECGMLSETASPKCSARKRECITVALSMHIYNTQHFFLIQFRHSSTVDERAGAGLLACLTVRYTYGDFDGHICNSHP